ncbi:hypothetical protein A1353_10360 [Methylomonas methanica]|uniref:NACHT domain-containing protein n=1 Tax=Methylomonas methanica TaxID=421 RepID=A0A177MJU3_METMH|nr:NACHT domain-containing protein [Methylomonas methanica]OAI06077.1 hypothetical protein A1353_10360 [Methylomonas methanica]
MTIEISAILFELVKKLVFEAISKKVQVSIEPFLTRRKIESRIDDSIAQVVEQLVPFFESERVSENHRKILITTCESELTLILKTPQDFFAASLDGQKLFDQRYADGQLPKDILDEGLKDLYALVFPQIANLVCMYPPAVEAWKIEGFRDNFRRLDDIATTLGTVAKNMDTLLSRDISVADGLLIRVRQSLAQRVEFQLDLTGLRGDRPDAVPIEQCFVIPELGNIVEETAEHSIHKKLIKIGTESEITNTFTVPAFRGLVIGAPGSGKSTWSRWLQKLRLTQNEPRLAMLIRLRELVKQQNIPSYLDLVREAAGTHLRDEVSPITVREWCQSGVITLILDGFDEVPPAKRDSILQWIIDLGSAVENAGVILTSRPLTSTHLDQLSQTWNRWELQPFDEPRVIDYITRWYTHAPLLAGKAHNIDANELARLWLHDPVLHPLVGSPLMLATLLMVHHMDGELPRGRAKLYERYIDGMLGLWDSRWGIPSAIDLTPDIKTKIFTRLALHLHLTENEQLGDEEIRQWFTAVLPTLGCNCTPNLVIDHLRERTGLLIGPGTWSFVHKSVGEFLVAAAIRDGDQTDDSGQRIDRLRLFAERHNDRWNTVLFFWAGLTAPGDLQSFIERVIEEPELEDFVLALSLIYDQLLPHRLSESWLTNHLLDLFNKKLEIKIEKNSQTRFICSPLPKDINGLAEVPFDPYLRTLYGVDIRQAVWECLSSSLINWSQVNECHESILLIIWLFFITEPKSVEDLRSALSVSTRPNNLPSEWILFALTWGLDEAAREKSGVSLAQYIDLLHECIPERSGQLVFFLMGLLTSSQQWNHVTLENQHHFFQNLLQAIEFNNLEKIDLNWLQLTREYTSFPDEKNTFDLLEEFLNSLNNISDSYSIEDNTLINVRNFTVELKELRDRV